MRIYVASSWRNTYQPSVVKLLRHLGHDVYDFRNPAPGNSGFAWSAIDPNWQSWSPDAYRKALEHPVAKNGYGLDIGAVRWCDAGVLVLPSGRSASFEFGHIMGQGKPGVVYMPEACEPELMYSEARILVSEDELRSHFQPVSRRLGVNRIGMVASRRFPSGGPRGSAGIAPMRNANIKIQEMTMPKRIPICAAKKFVKEQDLRHVIICAWDGKLSHVVTYGRTVEDCVQAAEGGNRIKRLLGWPDSLQAEPARVKAIRRKEATRIAAQVEKWISEAQSTGLLDWEKIRICTMEAGK